MSPLRLGYKRTAASIQGMRTQDLVKQKEEHKQRPGF